VISDEAIEAAAEALVGSTLGDRGGIKWEEFFEAARLALTAAAPYISAATLEEAADSADKQEIVHITPRALRRRAKSYRPTV
jgi:hypothetical protein